MKIDVGLLDSRFHGDSVRIYLGNHRQDLTYEDAKELLNQLQYALRQYPTTASTGQPDKPSAS